VKLLPTTNSPLAKETTVAAPEGEKLYGKLILPKELLKYRELSKLKSTYIDALPELVDDGENGLLFAPGGQPQELADKIVAMITDKPMMKRMGRFGEFYSCTNYPDCKLAIKAKPTGKICDYVREDKGNQPCGNLMMEGTKTIPERCSDKACPNHRPDRLTK